MIITFIVMALFAGSVYLFMQHPKFGRGPSGARLERIRNSPNYANGAFQNQSPTPALAEGASYTSVLWKFLFGPRERVKPEDSIPAVKTDLLHLSPDENVLVWFGHSSYFMQVDGKTFLADPVLSGAASPLSFTTRSFNGTDIYTVDDLPAIDYLLISHDHWDHLDYETVLALKPKTAKIITGLGTAEHLEYWGFDPAHIYEEDWNTEIKLDSGFTIYTAPARHFSGRSFKRNGSLWTSFVLKTPTMRIYLGGDSGYDSHFAEIGKQHGPFDLAILENGQYDPSWKYIHMMPEEVVKAAGELGAKTLFPVHSSKFALGNHAWDDPLKRVTTEAKRSGQAYITPRIGEKVRLGDSSQVFEEWWTGLR